MTMSGEFLPEIGHHLGFGVVHGQRSKGFQALLNGIAAAKTKHEEDKIVQKELLSLKDNLGSSKLTAKQIRELLIQLIYCEMLGHDASFGYINAIKYAEQTELFQKKTGYLAASIFLNKNHNLVCLLINTIQKDLKSTNVVAKSTALNVICNLVDAEKIPPLLSFVVAALDDKRVEIRKKALITLKHIYQLSEDLVPNFDEKLRSALSDRDPIVVSAALQFFHILIQENPPKYCGYLKVFLQILTQVLEGKLSEYNFHGVQAPWIQIKLLKILALLGHQNRSCSESMSAALLNMMRSLPTDCNIGCAVMFECIRTATTIYPLKPLLDLAAKKTTLFLTSNSSDLKCLGITAITALVELNTSYAGDDKLQQVIIKCLDDDDRTIGKKILELLYKITNAENVCVICERLLVYMKSTTEQSIKNDVAKNLAQLANHITWYVDTMNDVIQTADSPVQPDIMHGLLKAISGAENDHQGIITCQYLELMNNKNLSESLVQVSCWVVGEYGYLIQEDTPLSSVLSQLTGLVDRKFEDAMTYDWIMTAIAKLTRQMGIYLSETSRTMDRYRTGFPAELRQRCHEINVLAVDMSLMKNAIPLTSSEEDIKICPSLSFLDNYVANALSAGALPYQQNFSDVQDTSETNKESKELRFKPYEDPFSRVLDKDPAHLLKDKPSIVHPSSESTITNEEVKLKQQTPKKSKDKPKAKTVWGPSGYIGNKIKKSSEDQDKVTKSSSGRSSSEDFKQPSQHKEKSAVNFVETKKIESSLPSNTNLEQSAGVSLFAGIKPKSKEDTLKKVKTDTSDELLTEDTSNVSQEQDLDLEKELESSDQSGELVVNLDEGKSPLDLEKQIIGTNEESTSSHNTEFLLHSIGDDSQECLEPLSEGSAGFLDSACQVERSSQSILCPKEDINKGEGLSQHSFMKNNDAEIGEKDDCVKQVLSIAYGSQKDVDYKELCIDNNLRLVTCVVHNQSELVMMMKLTNHNQSRVPVEEISLKIEPPSNLIADSSQTKVTVDKLNFLETVNREISMKYQYPGIRMVFKGTLRYSVSKNSKVLNFEQELPGRHLFRPLAMSTEEFGKKWTSMSCDVREHVTMTSRRSREEIASDVANYIHFQVIDIKGSEAILAGSILGNDLCLLHVNVQNTEMELWVKSSNKKLSEMIMKECLSAGEKL